MWEIDANSDTGMGNFDVSDGERTFVAFSEEAAAWLAHRLALYEPFDIVAGAKVMGYEELLTRLGELRRTLRSHPSAAAWEIGPEITGRWAQALDQMSDMIGRLLARVPVPAGVALIDAAVRVPDVTAIDAGRRANAVHASRIGRAGWLGEVGQIIVDAMGRVRTDLVRIEAWEAMLVEIGAAAASWNPDSPATFESIEKAVGNAYGMVSALVGLDERTWQTMFNKIEVVVRKSREG